MFVKLFLFFSVNSASQKLSMYMPTVTTAVYYDKLASYWELLFLHDTLMRNSLFLHHVNVLVQ